MSTSARDAATSRTRESTPPRRKQEANDTSKKIAEGGAGKGGKDTSSKVAARFIQCYLLMGVRVFHQGMRNAIPAITVFISKDLGISMGQRGMLISAASAGYFFTQVPGGRWAEQFGPKIVISIALALSALCLILAPICADLFGVPGLWLTFALLGAVQGPLFPATTVFLSRWLPKAGPGGADEKAWGTSMLDIGISIGALLIIPVTSSIADFAGWKAALYVVGLLSLVFVALFHLSSADEPKMCRYISDSELRFLETSLPKSVEAKAAKAAAGSEGEDVPGLLGIPNRLVLHKGMWAVFIAHMSFNFGAKYLTNWSPTYYAEVMKMSAADAKYHLMAPHIANLATKIVNPLLVGFLGSKGVSTLHMRKIFTVSGFVLAAAAIAPVHLLHNFNPWISTLFFSAANGFFGFCPCGFKANYLDITEKYVGSVSGFGNSLATISSWAGPQIVAYLLSQFQSWDLVLGSVALGNLFAAAIYIRWATVVPIEREGPESEKKDK
eukprot:TRINITY_DN15581_c0_g1_i1.p1 TRINITY_DN15581_c0_g1~~TRINITY_DN15581_c0_g1_i1.p1  ORF type:complete len:515 (-),score=95.66 TRINITY_DN15581_c0_g1_i1:73-1566(-)